MGTSLSEKDLGENSNQEIIIANDTSFDLEDDVEPIAKK